MSGNWTKYSVLENRWIDQSPIHLWAQWRARGKRIAGLRSQTV